MKTIVFRVDSATIIGSGHLMRCLTLAQRLRAFANVLFICRDLDGHLGSLVEKSGFEIIYLPREYCDGALEGYLQWLTVPQEHDAAQSIEVLAGRQVDCLIVDHYALDFVWEDKMRPYVKKIMVIDDLANRYHVCDIFLDQNELADLGDRYGKLIPTSCRQFLGLRYLLLREEFYEAKRSLKEYDGKIRRVFIFFGSSDPTNETLKTLQAIVQLNCQDIVYDVVVGMNNQSREVIVEFCRNNKNMFFHCQVDYIARLMAQADAAIGAAGAAVWERCFLGVPSLVISVADNQGRTRSPRAFDKNGPYLFLGWHEDISIKKLVSAMQSFFSDTVQLCAINQASLCLFGDEDGVSLLVEEVLR